MSKSHRDNHKSRKKRGAVAFNKKSKRRKKMSKCSICGTKCRIHKLVDDCCPICWDRVRVA